MVSKPGPVTSHFQLNRMRDETSCSSLPWPPACSKDATSTHHLQDEQSETVAADAAVALLKAVVDSSSSAQLELSSDSCCFSNSTLTGEHSESFSSASEASVEASVEAVIRGLRSSDRLFCEPAVTSSLVEAEAEAEEEVQAAGGSWRPAPLLQFEGSVAVAVDSEDPYRDFKASMEEMVMAHGDADDWGWLEGMLEWYLRANGEGSQGIIVDAFVDVLLTLASYRSTSASATNSRPSVACNVDEQMKKESNNKKKTNTKTTKKR